MLHVFTVACFVLLSLLHAHVLQSSRHVQAYTVALVLTAGAPLPFVLFIINHHHHTTSTTNNSSMSLMLWLGLFGFATGVLFVAVKEVGLG